MTVGDGQVLGVTTVVDNGPNSLRWNMVILGDGYRSLELAKYAIDVENFINTIKNTKPFDDLWNAINVHRVDIASIESGADDPLACGGTGATPKTYFDATFCARGSGIRRLLTVDETTAIQVANNIIPEFDMLLVLVNSSIHGGSGGYIGTSSTAEGFSETVIHEIGHSAFKLADEYEYYSGCESGETGRDRYVGSEYFEPNVTINTDRNTNKWNHLILPETPIPTTSNAKCTQCDSQPNPQDNRTVGLFEGARYYHCGVFRPEFNCKMRSLGSPFCSVCQHQIRKILVPFHPTGNIDNNLSIVNIKSNGYQKKNVPQNTIDNNLKTRWSKEGFGSWIQADLGITKLISTIDIAWHKGNERRYNFSILTSIDGTSFTTAFTGKSSGTTLSLEKYNLPSNTNARYIKIQINGNNQNKWASITEIDIYG
jgi:hypothetical protein